MTKKGISRIINCLEQQHSTLNLSNCQIHGGEKELTMLLEAKSFLKELILDENHFRSLAIVEGLDHLERLSFRDNYIAEKDFHILGSLKNLKALNLYHNRIDDITFLQHLTSLKELNIGYNWIKDFSQIAALANLEILNISQNHEQITDLSFLENLQQLKELNLYNSGIKNIAPLTTLANLEVLNLEYNTISSLLPLKKLTNLVELDVHYIHKQPPLIWFVHFMHYGGKLGDYLNDEELVDIDKIWSLLSTRDLTTTQSAEQPALSIGRQKKDFQMYLAYIQ